MEAQFLGFVFEVFDAIAGQIARIVRSGGTKTAPVTIRSPFGGWRTQHLNCTQIT